MTASKIATLVSAVFVLWHHSLSQKAHTRPIQNKRDELVVWIFVMLIWPHIWEWMANGCWGGASVGLAWPYAVMMYNILRGVYGDLESPPTHIEPSGLCSLTFAIAGMIGARDCSRQQTWIFVSSIVIFMCERRTRTMLRADPVARTKNATIQTSDRDLLCLSSLSQSLIKVALLRTNGSDESQNTSSRKSCRLFFSFAFNRT